MEINDLLKLLDGHNEQLSQILNDCTAGPDELTLLASKLQPILDEYSEARKELHAPDEPKQMHDDG